MAQLPKTNSKSVPPKGAKTPLSSGKKHVDQQNKWFLISLIVVGVSIIGIITFGLLDHFLLRQNKTVARVDNQKITVSEFQKRAVYTRWQISQQYSQYMSYYQMLGGDPNYTSQISQTLEELKMQLSSSYAPVLGENILDRMMQELLIQYLANKQGITVSDAEIQKEMQEAFGYYANGTPTLEPTAPVPPTPTTNPKVFTLITQTPTVILPTPAPTEPPPATPTPDPSVPTVAALPTETPYPTATPITEEGYATQVAKYIEPLQPYQYTQADFTKIFRTQLLETKLMEAVTKDLQPVEEQIWARHILVGTENQTLANEIYDKLMNGGDFVELSKEYSIDSSGAGGGDLGWFGKGRMVTEFEDAAYALQPGEISKPVLSQFGWHIIQCIDRAERPLSSTEFKRLKENQFDKWLKEQETSVKYEKYDIWREFVPTEPGIPE